MPIKLEDAQARAKKLQEAYKDRNTDFGKFENMYLLEPDPLPTGSHIKRTLDPSPRNAVQTMARIMTVTPPKWSMPKDKNNPESMSIASKLERAATAIESSNNRVTGKRLHAQVCLSALVYSEMHVVITRTADLIQVSSGARKKRAERAGKFAPVLFEVLNPAQCFPLFDAMGLAAHASKRQMTVGDIWGRYGEKADVAGELDQTKPKDVWEYWDIENHFIWVDGASKPLNSATDNPLEFIPIACGVCEGGELFTQAGQSTRQPVLYTPYKAGLWAANNINLTLQTSLAFAVGANPVFVYRSNDPNKEPPIIDFSVVGGQVIIGKDELYEPMAKNAIDPSLNLTWQQLSGLMEQSTMYKQVGGQSMGSGTAFSTVSMMNQNGRIPIAPYKAGAEDVLSRAMGMALEMCRSGKVTAMGSNGLIDLEPNDIPEAFDIVCTLKVDQSSDERQNAVLAVQLTQGPTPLVSHEWALEKILEVEQPDEMLYQIAKEQFVALEMQKLIQQGQMPTPEQIAQMQAGQGQGGAPGAPQGQPGQPGQPPMGNPQDAFNQLQQAGPGMEAAQPMTPGGNGPGPGLPGQMPPGLGGM